LLIVFWNIFRGFILHALHEAIAATLAGDNVHVSNSMRKTLRIVSSEKTHYRRSE